MSTSCGNHFPSRGASDCLPVCKVKSDTKALFVILSIVNSFVFTFTMIATPPFQSLICFKCSELGYQNVKHWTEDFLRP